MTTATCPRALAGPGARSPHPAVAIADLDGVGAGLPWPTFDDGEERTVEAYLLDFDGDLYTRALSLEFVRRLRPEEEFTSVEALVKQMEKDVDNTRIILEQDSQAVEPNR